MDRRKNRTINKILWTQEKIEKEIEEIEEKNSIIDNPSIIRAQKIYPNVKDYLTIKFSITKDNEIIEKNLDWTKVIEVLESKADMSASMTHRVSEVRSGGLAYPAHRRIRQIFTYNTDFTLILILAYPALQSRIRQFTEWWLSNFMKRQVSCWL